MNTTVILVIGLVVFAIAMLIMVLKISQMQESLKSSVKDSLLENIHKLYTSISDLKEEYGKITSTLSTLSDISNDTKTLKSYLTNTKIRGYWGERLVEDIINIVGLKEGINYVKQTTDSDSRPDFTFYLPNGKVINLDAKFPLDNYKKFIEAQSEAEKESFKKEFIKDVKNRINEVAKKNYVNENTVDFASVFIANEGTYAFLLSEEPGIIDEALSKQIVLTSPTTLYALLSVLRKATEYYILEKSVRDVLDLMVKFEKEWGNYLKEFDKLDKAINDLKDTYNKLVTTRKDKLDSVLTEIESKKALMEETENETQEKVN
ncbi:DNA recombination protein RmuC [Caldisericum exile]|uniref:RmuC family protein n=1 Tax=Caldisericum exile (strain DSM 21853 / NBRC 104410 / AZM16c01) TaxID=511051 RepID=A0A7U6GE05_CALEA|nr:DNA recombination protein RmuC [Caldisericum exile]BAL80651.1 RmuC family protein [Caldisericum exile AZM16c01]